jgi:hypothetical protein
VVESQVLRSGRVVKPAGDEVQQNAMSWNKIGARLEQIQLHGNGETLA